MAARYWTILALLAMRSGKPPVMFCLAAIGFYRLPLDYLDRFNERVEAVSAEQIRDAFQRRVHPNRLAVVIVGPEEEEGDKVAQTSD